MSKPDATSRPEAVPAGDVASLKKELHHLKDQQLRLLADLDNAKKRLHREKEEFARYATETVIRGLLPIIDSLDQALVAVDPSTRPAAAGLARDSAPQTEGEARAMSAGLRKQSDIEGIVKGVQLIRRQLLGLLEREGVKRIPTVGEPFDPHKHEAVAQVEPAPPPPGDRGSGGVADDTIVEEVQVGYTMHDKVIRPAMVKVATKARPETSDRRQETKE